MRRDKSKGFFILTELFICIALLSICVMPLIGYPYYSYRKQREQLLEIEKQRQAEILFYELLKNIKHQYAWDHIDRRYSDWHSLKTIFLDIDGLGKISFSTHYHLCHFHPEKHEQGDAKNLRKIWCVFCFETSSIKCSYKKKKKEHPYKFVFYAKKV